MTARSKEETECPACGRELNSFQVQPHDVLACRSAHSERVRPELAALARQWADLDMPPLPSRVARRLQREQELATKRGEAVA